MKRWLTVWVILVLALTPLVRADLKQYIDNSTIFAGEARHRTSLRQTFLPLSARDAFLYFVAEHENLRHTWNAALRHDEQVPIAAKGSAFQHRCRDSQLVCAD